MRTTLQHLLSDAASIEAQPPQEQERIIAALMKEIEQTQAQLAKLSTEGATLGAEDSGNLLKMYSALGQARQCCPQCQAAQMPMPQMNWSACSAPPMMQNTMRAIVPYQAQAVGYGGYGGGMFDNLADGSAGMLTMGMKGAEVQRLQGLLKAAGYSVKADGDFGQKTQQAVEKFQAANGLRADGRVKDTDWTKLQEIVGKKTGATKRAEEGKNTVPTTSEKVANVSETLVRVVVPIVIAGGTGATLWLLTKQSNIPKKAVMCVGAGIGAGAVSYIGLNALADAMTSPPNLVPEEKI